MTADHVERLRLRAATFDVDIPLEQACQLLGYVALLERWNTRINLTALPLAGLPDESMDRLLLEPVLAAAAIPTGARDWTDVGSGGGSPAIPLKLLRPELHLTMLESRSRKAAFLREAVRQLELADTLVLEGRLETVAETAANSADVVTSRGVRLDESAIAAIQKLLRPAGHLLVFGSGSELIAPGLTAVRSIGLPAGELTVFQK